MVLAPLLEHTGVPDEKSVNAVNYEVVLATSRYFAGQITAAEGNIDQARLLWAAGPAGAWLVAIIGVVIIGVGIAHFIKAWQAKFERHFEMNEQERDVITPVSRIGLAARGAAFLIIGGLFIAAAAQHEASEAGGLADAFYTLQQQPFGQWLLGALAFGLMAFGAYSIIEAFYRRVEIAG